MTYQVAVHENRRVEIVDENGGAIAQFDSRGPESSKEFPMDDGCAMECWRDAGTGSFAFAVTEHDGCTYRRYVVTARRTGTYTANENSHQFKAQLPA